MQVNLISKSILGKIKYYNDTFGVSYNLVFNELVKEFGEKETPICILDLIDQEMIEVKYTRNDPINPYYMLRESTIRIKNKGRLFLSPLTKLAVLQRYKVLCEWYEKDVLSKKGEVDITRYHLSRYLFDEGFLPITEHQVPSGRVDATLISDNGEFIPIEAKIFSGNKKDICDLKNQIIKRLEDFGVDTGYGVIYNKTDKVLELSGLEKDGEFSVMSFLDKKIYFICVRLNDKLFKSTLENTICNIAI